MGMVAPTLSEAPQPKRLTAKDAKEIKALTTAQRSHNQKPKPTTEARRHGEDQNQFSPERTQRSRATTKTILYHRGHEGTRREPKPKLTAEVAKEAQRAQSRTDAIKICIKNEEIFRLVLQRGTEANWKPKACHRGRALIQPFLPLIYADER